MLIVGVSGVTNGGKTTLAEALHSALPKSHLLCQDAYFLPRDDDRHTLIPELNHFNWEIMSSLDMARMWEDIKNVLSKRSLPAENSYDSASSIERNCKVLNQLGESAVHDIITDSHINSVSILIIEGFLVLNYKPIVDICHLKYHLTLDKADCISRRNSRQYDPPDVPGYFDVCVWPEYVKHKEEMLQTVKDVKLIDGTRDNSSIFNEVMSEITEKIKTIS